MKFRARMPIWMWVGLFVACALPILLEMEYLLGVVVALVVAYIYPRSYQMGALGIVMKFGAQEQIIPYSRISLVKPEGRGGLIGANGVRLVYGANQELIMVPDSQEEFIEEVANHATHLVRNGQTLTRRFPKPA
jgi:hypothetical protein